MLVSLSMSYTPEVECGYSFFSTSIGRCAIVFGPQGIQGVCLPERTVAETRTRILARYSGARELAPTGVVSRAIDQIAALLAGKPAELSAIPLDMRGLPPFHVKVYEAARRIGPGVTLSYGELAERLGSRGAARAVGQALSRNPFAIVVPCHRVLGAKGKIGGFTAAGGVETKRQMLLIEQSAAKLESSSRPQVSPAATGVERGSNP